MNKSKNLLFPKKCELSLEFQLGAFGKYGCLYFPTTFYIGMINNKNKQTNKKPATNQPKNKQPLIPN